MPNLEMRQTTMRQVPQIANVLLSYSSIVLATHIETLIHATILVDNELRTPALHTLPMPGKEPS